MRVYLGTHMVNWLADSPAPLFISRRRLHERKTFPRAGTPAAAAKPKQNTVVETTPCRVDGCDGFGARRGRDAALCKAHRDELAAGGAVLVSGVQHQRLGQGNTASLARVRATHCEDCGAKLSKYRKATETRCATHAGVTAS